MRCNIMRKFGIFLILMAVPFILPAQTTRLLTTQDGLCSTDLRALALDSDGNLWIGTQSGLNKYDGFNVSSYYCRPSDKNALVNDVIQVLEEDKQKNLYIGTQNGLSIFSLDNRTFHTVDFQYNEEPNIQSIVARQDGSVLIATQNNGLYTILHENENDYSAVPFALTDTMSTMVISAMFEDTRGTLWMWVASNGLFALTSEGELEKVMDMPGGNDQYSINSICEDALGYVYFAGNDTGLLIRRDDGSFEQLLPRWLARGRVNKIFFHEGDIYVCTQRNGVIIYNPENRTTSRIEFSDGKENFANNLMNDILFDSSETMIAAINHKGVLMKFPGNEFLENVELPQETDDLGHNVTHLSVNAAGNVWVSTDSDGGFLMDKDFKAIRHILPGTNVTSIIEDAGGTLWFGIPGRGLHKMEPGKSEAEAYTLLNRQRNAIRNVTEIIEDRGHNLWVAGRGSGLFKISPDRNEYVLMKQADDAPETDGLFNRWINCLEMLRGKLYIGTYNGLLCYNTRANTFLDTFQGRNHIMEGVVINDIEEDSEQNIWLATTSGLTRIDHETQEQKTYTYSDGLPQNNILSVEVDVSGRIWVSTPNGLACLNPENEQVIRLITSQPGSNEYSRNCSSEISEEGTMIFGSHDGLSYFNPNRTSYSSAKHDIRLAGIIVGDNYDQPGKHRDGHITLKHSENSFSVELTTGLFSDNRQASFAYRVDGGDIQHLPKGVNRITFNKMKAGRHHLTVMCNSPEKRYENLDLAIKVKNPWYASPAATIGYGVLLLGLAICGGLLQRKKYRKSAEEQKNKHELEMNEAKLQFFFNLAHEIRMPMSLIISPLNKLMATDTEASRQVQYRMMENNARRITLLINQIMDIRKIEKGKLSLSFSKTDINQYVRQLVDVMQQSAMLKSITLSFTPAQGSPDVWVDVNQFDKVVLNLLHNAIKFTPAGGLVELNMKTDQKELVLYVTDNGMGIDEDKLENIFESFYQVKDTSSELGVGIGLNLSKSIVNMHSGNIRAFNNLNSTGMTFEVRIPLGRGHISDSQISIPDKSDEHAKLTADMYESLGDNAAIVEENVKTKPRHSVAVVEDSEEIRQYLVNELSSDYNVTAYENGEEALNGILKSPADIVISDVIMPKMDGYQLCEKLKRNVNTNAIPVILLTGKVEEIDKITGMDVGADAYVTKPFSIIYLKKNIEQLLDSFNRLRNIYTGRQEAKIDNIPEVNDPDDVLLERINKALNDNIRNPELNVDFLAKEACLSRVHLYRKLTELTNQSPGEYIRTARLKMAADLLVEKNLDISTVATETGFSSISVFSRAFKQLYGISPSEYQNKEKRERG